jgi:hypothetical protein
MSSGKRISLRNRLARRIGIAPSGSSSGSTPAASIARTSGTGRAAQSIVTVSSITPSIDHSQAFLADALKKLPDKERAVVESNAASNIGDAVSAAYDAAEKQRIICEDKRWPISAKAKQVILWLDRFKGVGNVAANADPINAGLPWAGVRFLLTVLVADIAQMNALMEGMELALKVTNRLCAYFAYFQQLPAHLTTDNLRSALVDLYALILKFFATAIDVYSSHSAQRKLQAIWQESEIKLFEGQCNALANHVEIAVHNCDRHLNAESSLAAARWRSDLEAQLKRLDSISKIEASLEEVHVKIDLSKLLIVPTATYDSSEESLLPTCLEGTRVDLLRLISDWSTDTNGKCIFWLCGKAGTGKSTISRTVAKSLEESGTLAASFFFKRGYAGRGNADRFFTTIVAQLSDRIPALRALVAEALDKDSFICSRGLQEQFDKLLQGPLKYLGLTQQLPQVYLTVVIDALDECDRRHTKKFFNLLASVNSISTLHLRIFVTSRPELPIEIGFKNIDGALHEDVYLEQVQSSTIAADLRTYFVYKFAEIRADCSPPLPPEWPSPNTIEKLVTLAVPLFIFAATVCRFLGEGSPQKRLNGILDERHAVSSLRLDNDYTHLRLIYSQILQQITASSLGEAGSEDVEQIKRVLGPIVVAANPLSVDALSSLTRIDAHDIRFVVERLKSVLNVPQDPSQPIQTLHLSFREFLLDTKNNENIAFRIDEQQTHAGFARQCICILLTKDALRQDICSINTPGRKRHQITDAHIAQSIPRDVAYACMYWPYHLVASGGKVTNNSPAFKLLTTHLLHWLEAMSWLGRYNLAVSSIIDLCAVSEVNCYCRKAHLAIY